MTYSRAPFVIFVWPYSLEGPPPGGETFSTFALDNRKAWAGDMSDADSVYAQAWRRPAGRWLVYPKLPGQPRHERSAEAPPRTLSRHELGLGPNG